jgi:tetratricopeptide (TPR) repeat protein
VLKTFVTGLFLSLIAVGPSAAENSCAGVATVTDQNGSAELLMQAARVCVHEGDLERATSLLSQAIELDPDNPMAYLDRGTVYAKKGEEAAGLRDFTHVISKKPDMAEAWYGRGTTYVELGQLDSGIADLTQAIRLSPNMSLAYCNRGMAYQSKGSFDLALDDLHTAVRDDSPVVAFCYFALGKLFMDQNKFEQAIESFTKGIERIPSSAEALAYRGRAHEQLGDLEKALADYQAALRVNPSLKAPSEGLQRLRSEPAACTSVPSLPEGAGNKDRVNALRKLAAFCVHQQRFDDAVSILDQVIEIESNNMQAHLDRGAVLVKSGKLQAGLEDFNAVIRAMPDSAVAWYSRGTIYVSADQLEAGISDLTQAIHLKPDMAAAYCARGIAYMTQHEFEKAESDLVAGIKLHAADPYCYFALGKVLLSKQEYDDAADNFTKGIQLLPTAAEALQLRGEAYERLGLPDKASSDYRSALAVDPSLKPAIQALERLNARPN